VWTADKEAKIVQYLASLSDANDPGLAAGILLDGKIVLEHYQGIANLEHQAPITPLSRFNIASAAKQFTALCILQLMHEGKLSLDDDFRTYLPSYFSELDTPITIKQLITHTSGVRDYCELMSLQGTAWWKRVGLDNDDALALLADQVDLNFTPGTDYSYSNSNYTILAELVEERSNMSFTDYTQQLFTTLGMTDSDFMKNYMRIIPHKVEPYSDWGDGVWKEYPMVVSLHGDGFLFTTLRDQLRYEQAIMDERLPFLAASQNPIPGVDAANYGYGLELQDRNNQQAVHHSGSTGSYSAQTVRYPSLNLSIVVMSNNSTLWSGTVADELFMLLQPQNKPNLTKKYTPPSPKNIPENINGTYLTSSGIYYSLKENGSNALLSRNGSDDRTLIQKEQGVYYWKDYPSVFYVVDLQDDGSQRLSIYNETGFLRMGNKLEPFTSTSSYLKSLTGIYKNKETATSIALTVDDNQLFIKRANKKRKQALKAVAKGDFVSPYYTIKMEENNDGTVDILMTYETSRNVRFQKQ